MKKAKFFSFCLFLAISLYCQATKADIPDLTGPVMDPSGILSPTQKEKLTSILLEYQKESSNQIVLYITPKLKFDTIESEAINVFEKWKLGEKGKDNGVLFLLAPNDRQVRIEVGYGLESALTDISSKRIINELIIPKMKAGEITGAVSDGILAIIDQINSESPSLLSKVCPSVFSDASDRLHKDTIPMIQKNIKSRKSIKNYYIQFCVSDAKNPLSMEAQANGIFRNISSPSKNRLVFIVGSDVSGNYFGKITLNAELSWLMSENRKKEIFRNQYEYTKEGDFTNFTYNAFLETLDTIEQWENENQKIIAERGLQDPHSVLVPFSKTNIDQAIEKIETDLKLPTSILFVKTSADLEIDSKKYLKLIFKDESGILLLISLNQKDLFVYTNENTIFPSQAQGSKKINNLYLSNELRSVVKDYVKQGDIDWVGSSAATSLYYLINNYYPKENSPSIDKKDDVPTTQAVTVPLFWTIGKSLAYLSLLVFLANHKGIPFFAIFFYAIYDSFRHLVGEFSYPIEIMFVFICAALSYLFVYICRILKITAAYETFLKAISEYTKSSGDSTSNNSSSRSSSSSYSSSSSRSTSSSSSSSYSGGGGSSGGGGASGSW